MNRVQIELVPVPPTAALAGEWRRLEDRSDASFFVSWSWIGCWLQTLPDTVDLRLLRASIGGATVGLGLLAPWRERRHGIVWSRTLRLHATGRPQFDVLTVECNGFLVERGSGSTVARHMFDHLVRSELGWDELVLDGLWNRPQWTPSGEGGLRTRARVEAAHYVDLAQVRGCGGDYLSLLGPRTRAKIRRSIKEYERHGAIVVAPAADAKQALAFLGDLEALHQAYWTGRGQPGAFASVFFGRFHRRLVVEAFERGEIQLLAVDVGARRLGCIYNFVYRGRVYNYQSGFDYGLCEKHNRPGLVAHVRAIEFNGGCGHAVYDFLAGDVEYKRALGTSAGSMSWHIVQRDRVRFRLEDAARVLRARLQRRKPAAHPAEKTCIESLS